MRSLSYVDLSADQSLRRRAGPLVLTIAAHLLLLLLLLRLAPELVKKPPVAAGPLTVSLLPNEADDMPRAATKSKHQSSAAAKRATTVPTPKPPPVPPVVPPVLPKTQTDVIYLGKADMAQADIAKMPSAHAGQAAAGEGTGTALADSGEGVGRGPAGQKLYNAEWYRQPTDAELNFYLKPSMPHVGVALIACQTVARFHVDNCVQLGEQPTGSGLSRAMVDAAWQFLVRPPRVGGRPLVGEWVRIEIDFTSNGARSGRSARD